MELTDYAWKIVYFFLPTRMCFDYIVNTNTNTAGDGDLFECDVWDWDMVQKMLQIENEPNVIQCLHHWNKTTAKTEVKHMFPRKKRTKKMIIYLRNFESNMQSLVEHEYQIHSTLNIEFIGEMR